MSMAGEFVASGGKALADMHLNATERQQLRDNLASLRQAQNSLEAELDALDAVPNVTPHPRAAS